MRYRRMFPGALEPRYQSAEASGMDLHAAELTSLRAGETGMVLTGIAVELDHGTEAQVRPRSSVSRRGLLVHLGTIDADYRGEIAIILTNLGQFERRIAIGERLAQLVVSPVIRVHLVETDALGWSERGSSGFGSTGE
jgi:dUTP pyrophosphatase